MGQSGIVFLINRHTAKVKKGNQQLGKQGKTTLALITSTRWKIAAGIESRIPLKMRWFERFWTHFKCFSLAIWLKGLFFYSSSWMDGLFVIYSSKIPSKWPIYIVGNGFLDTFLAIIKSFLQKWLDLKNFWEFVLWFFQQRQKKFPTHFPRNLFLFSFLISTNNGRWKVMAGYIGYGKRYIPPELIIFAFYFEEHRYFIFLIGCNN